MNTRGHSRSNGRHIGRRTVLGAGVVGAGAVVAWKVLGDSDGTAIATPPERQSAWTYPADGASAGLSRLNVSGDSLYLTAGGPLSVHALSAGTGRRRWVAEVSGDKPGDVTLGPVTIAGGTVYALAEGGHVTALADADGSRRWASEPLGGGPPEAPVVIGSTVCVLMGTKSAADEAGGTRTLVKGVLCGLEAGTGRVKWRAGGNRLLLEDRHRGQLIADDRDGDRLSALDPQTGEPRWSLPKQDSVALGPQLLYATGTGTADEVSAYDLSTGERRWKAAAPPKESADTIGAELTVSADGRTVHVCDVGTGAVYAYDARTGDRRWRITVDSPAGPAAASGGAEPGGAAFFLASTSGFPGAHPAGSGFHNPFSGGGEKPGGYVTARATTDGKQLWRTESGVCTSRAVAAQDWVLVAHDTQTWAYDARTGTARWCVTGEPGAGDFPLVADGRLYVVTDTGIAAVAL
ncbi:PQQ-binding-like beta-propeller repeat protein [Streptomyces sp. NPDC058221]|uniref:PQQ-like beta-propeller repeat protein n=1 Tax=Streptomyces sp. NPDC058221 TaxID=3346388 RepID=UPI0036EA33FB